LGVAFGSTTASRSSAATTSRSRRSPAFTRTIRAHPLSTLESTRAASLRAASFSPRATPSSRSAMTASAS